MYSKCILVYVLYFLFFITEYFSLIMKYILQHRTKSSGSVVTYCNKPVGVQSVDKAGHEAHLTGRCKDVQV